MFIIHHIPTGTRWHSYSTVSKEEIILHFQTIFHGYIVLIEDNNFMCVAYKKDSFECKLNEFEVVEIKE